MDFFGIGSGSIGCIPKYLNWFRSYVCNWAWPQYFRWKQRARSNNSQPVSQTNKPDLCISGFGLNFRLIDNWVLVHGFGSVSGMTILIGPIHLKPIKMRIYALSAAMWPNLQIIPTKLNPAHIINRSVTGWSPQVSMFTLDNVTVKFCRNCIRVGPTIWLITINTWWS